MANDNMNENFTQEIILPSKGLFNPEIPGGVIKQRCMMVSDQKKLLGSATKASPIYTALQETTISPKEFDVMNLTLADTLYVMFKLRILSYGNTYTFRTVCPNCGNKITVTVDLSTLQVDTLEEESLSNLVVVLPHRGDTVYTRLLSNQDLDNVNEEVKRRKRKNPEDQSDYVLRIVKSIEKVVLAKDKSELTHPIDLERYVNSLTDYDAASIIHARDSVIFGVTSVYDTICPDCNSDIEIGVNFSQNFFRPSFN